MINHHEHSKRVWSVVYNPAEPTMYASGSDDCSGKVVQQINCIIILYSIAADSSPFLPLSLAVKLWCTSRPHSIYKIDAKANVCSVRFHPVERHYLAYGSAGQHTLFSVVIFKKIFFFFLCLQIMPSIILTSVTLGNSYLSSKVIVKQSLTFTLSAQQKWFQRKSPVNYSSPRYLIYTIPEWFIGQQTVSSNCGTSKKVKSFELTEDIRTRRTLWAWQCVMTSYHVVSKDLFTRPTLMDRP